MWINLTVANAPVVEGNDALKASAKFLKRVAVAVRKKLNVETDPHGTRVLIEHAGTKDKGEHAQIVVAYDTDTEGAKDYAHSWRDHATAVAKEVAEADAAAEKESAAKKTEPAAEESKEAVAAETK
jgi:septal ring factor EnvC (AmiA/AmiB activator)